MTRRNLFSPVTTRRNVVRKLFHNATTRSCKPRFYRSWIGPRIDPRRIFRAFRGVARPSWFGVADRPRSTNRRRRSERNGRRRHRDRDTMSGAPGASRLWTTIQCRYTLLLLLLLAFHSNSEQDDVPAVLDSLTSKSFNRFQFGHRCGDSMCLEGSFIS